MNKFFNYYQVPNNLHKVLNADNFIVCCFLLRSATRKLNRQVMYMGGLVNLKQNELITNVIAITKDVGLNDDEVTNAINYLVSLNFVQIMNVTDKELFLKVNRVELFNYCDNYENE